MTTTSVTSLSPDAGDRASAPHDGVTRTLHWVTVALVLALYGLGLTWGFAPRGGVVRHGMIVTHMSLGIILTVVIVVRLIWRLMPQSSPTIHEGPLGLVARLVHGLLYLLLVAQAIYGWCWRWAGREELSFFGLAIPSPVTFPDGARHTFAVLHYWTAHAIVALAFGHAVAALAHHYVFKDRVLERMLGRA